MKGILLSALLLMPLGARAGTVFPQPDSAETRMVNWPQLKQRDWEMHAAYWERFRTDPKWNSKDLANLKKTLDDIWKLLESVESKSLANVRFMENAIDKKVAAGQMTPAVGDDLKGREGLMYTARMYFVYGNFWPRIMSEGYAELDPTPEKMFGANFGLWMTQEDLDQITARYDFKPEDYGLPKPPAIKEDVKSP